MNKLDGADPENEFKDYALANVAIQGFVRFLDALRGGSGPQLPKTFISQRACATATASLR